MQGYHIFQNKIKLLRNIAIVDYLILFTFFI